MLGLCITVYTNAKAPDGHPPTGFRALPNVQGALISGCGAQTFVWHRAGRNRPQLAGFQGFDTDGAAV